MNTFNRRTILSAAGLGLLALATGSGKAVQPRALVYWVRRDGDVIGEHQIAFGPTASGGQEVRFATDIAVKVAFITAYRFTHEATESWIADGHLLALDSRTDDDGTKHRVHAAAGREGLTVETSDGIRTLPTDTLVHDHWNKANVTRSRLLSIYDGTDLSVAFSTGVGETASVNDAPLQAHRYDATGDLTRSFWYDTSDRLVKVAFASRGSAITYELRS